MCRDSFSAKTGGRSSNGRTPDSGSGYPGSNPGLPAIFFFLIKNYLTHSRPHPLRPQDGRLCTNSLPAYLHPRKACAPSASDVLKRGRKAWSTYALRPCWHYGRPLHHAQHYLGFTDDLDARTAPHLTGFGGRLPLSFLNSASRSPLPAPGMATGRSNANSKGART